MNEMTVKVEFFSDKKNLDLIHNCLVCDRAPREIFNSYCCGSVYCKHHFSKIICSKGVCRNVKCGKKLSRESFLKALKCSNQQKNLLENKKNNGSVRSQCKSIDKAMANNSERGLGFDDPKISNGDLMKFIQEIDSLGSFEKSEDSQSRNNYSNEIEAVEESNCENLSQNSTENVRNLKKTHTVV